MRDGMDALRGQGIIPMEPFGALPCPREVETLAFVTSIGRLTAIRSRPGTDSDVIRGQALLVPGFTGSKEDFYDLLPLLSRRGWDVWAISQRGQADSSSPAGVDSYGRGRTAEDVIEVARRISVVGGGVPLHLVGHSFGGTVAQAAVIARPEAFTSLSLMSSGPHGWPGRKAALRQRLLDHPGGDLWRLDNPDLASVRDDELDVTDLFQRQRSERTSRDELIGAIDQLADVHDTTEEIAGTGLPVLVLHGEHDSRAWPREWQRLMARRLHARYEVIPGAGHCPNQEKPNETAGLLDDFWSHADGR